MSEVGEVHKVEGASTHVADLVIPSRRDMLNGELMKMVNISRMINTNLK